MRAENGEDQLGQPNVSQFDSKPNMEIPQINLRKRSNSSLMLAGIQEE